MIEEIAVMKRKATTTRHAYRAAASRPSSMDFRTSSGRLEVISSFDLSANAPGFRMTTSARYP
jgi:hypothetical protein